jgi:PIN domain nuclease of toxin-antitoxin system
VNLLLDTHIWIWSLLSPQLLSPRVVSELEASNSELWLSPISAWELLMLAERGRVSLDKDPLLWVGEALRATPFREAALTHEVAIESRRMGLETQDPADRFLAATAKVYGLTLVTSDARLIASTGFHVLANR